MQHFNQIVRLILKNSHFLVILPIVAMVALWHLTKDTPNKYEVKSKFLYGFDGESTSVSGETLSLQEIYTEFLNTIEIINSKKLAEKVTTKIAYESLNDSSQVFPFEWPDSARSEVNQLLLDILTDKRSPYLDNSDPALVVHAFYKHYKIGAGMIGDAITAARRVQSSNFLEIQMTYTNAEKLFYICNLLNELLTKEIENINKRNISKQKAIIEELVAKAKRELDAKIQELETLKVNNNIINLDEHTKAIVTYQVQLEQLRSTLRQQIASTKAAKNSIKKGIENKEYASVNKEKNQDILKQKNELYEAQDIKLIHLQKDIDYDQLIQQQENIKKNYSGLKKTLTDLSKDAIYDPTMVHTDLTMKFIDFKVKSERLEDELLEVQREIERVRNYAAYFAPFESAISTLRDEITTAQKTYLLFLNKLNITESLEVGASRSKLELVDYPEYPHEPLPSKTKLVIVAGGVVVFVMLIAFIVINYLLDSRIKDVGTFERRVGGNVVAALPLIPKKSTDQKLLKALDLINKEGIKKIWRKIDESTTITINTLNLHDETEQLINDLKAYWAKEKVSVIFVTGHKEEIEQQLRASMKKTDRLICVTNPLQFSYDGINLAEMSDCSFLLYPLNKVKTPANARAIQDLTNASISHKGFILTQLQSEYMDSYVGELPKRRIWIRRVIKNLINRYFLWK